MGIGKKNKAFTLIELLVVVGVIAILLALTFPALSYVKNLAKQSFCLNNMKQLALGFNLYANEYDGTIVPGRFGGFTASGESGKVAYWVGNGYKYRPRWYAQLGAAVKMYPFSNPSPLPADDNTQLVDNDAFLCPAPEIKMANGRNFGYGYNFQFLGNNRGNQAKTDYVNFPVKIADIKADTVCFADSMGTAAGNAERRPYDEGQLTYSDGKTAGLDKIGNHGWALDPPRLIDGLSDFCDNDNRGAINRSAPDPRHPGLRTNVAFCDGSAQSFKLDELGYEIPGTFTRFRGAVGLNGNNSMFSGKGMDVLPPPK
ncbi:MAG: type II secretion system protein [Victivallales bacterium]|nr:type II secretion system protein [Victivallales bacterium]